MQFTVEEENLICMYHKSDRRRTAANIRAALPDMNEEMRDLLQKKLNRKPDMVQDVGCAVSINSGPKMLGIGFLRQKG